MKIIIKSLSALLLFAMLFTALVPCVLAQTVIDNASGTVTADPTLNTSTTKRVYSFNNSEKADANKYILETDMGTGRSFLSIYEALRQEIKDGKYNFGSVDKSIGTPLSSWNAKVPEITEDHPRLLVTKDTIPTIRKALEENTPTNERFFEILDASTTTVNNGKLGKVQTDYDGRKGLHNYDKTVLEFIQIKALGYLVDGHELYGYQAIHCMKQFLGTLDIQYISSDQCREYGNTMFTAALVYDWCYDLLTPEDKRQLMAGIQNKTAKGNCGDPSYTTTTHYKYKMEVGYPPSGQGSLASHGSERQVLRDYLSAAIAFYGDNNSWWDYVAARIYSDYVPVRNYYFQSGLSQQGTGVYVYGRHIADMYSAWMLKTATGENPYVGMENTIRSFMGYECAPGKVFSEGDGTYSSQNLTKFKSLAYISAYLYADEPMLAWARSIDYRNPFTEQTIDLTSGMYIALLGMADIKPAENKYEGMDLLQYNGSPVGQYVTHSAWGSDSSANVFMKIKERNTANHEHADAGNFMIYYKGMLTADAGVYNGYGGDHTRYYHQATVSHNSLLVNNGSQNKNSSDKKVKYYSGGQIWPDEIKNNSGTLNAWLNSSQHETGTVIGHEDGYYDAAKTQPKYAYLGGDITAAYPASTVNFVGRRMLVVYTGDKDVPMVFFTYDTITSDSSSYKKTFLFHISSAEKPTIDRTNNTIKTENGGGQLVLTCVSNPNYIEIKGVGGRTYGTDGKLDDKKSGNYYINGYGQLPTTINFDDTSWGRVEISNTQNGAVVKSATTRFLNSMYVTDAGTTTYYPTKSITDISTNLSAGDFEGAVFNGSIAAVFTKRNLTKDNRFTTQTLSFTTEGNNNMSYYVDGLASGTWMVTVDGKNAGSYAVSKDSGLLTFEASAGKVVLVRESAEVSNKRIELINALGAMISNADGAYSASSYAAYTAAYDEIVTKISSATTLSALNAIDVANLKKEAEAKLTPSLDGLKEELLTQLGAKKSNSGGTYTSASYSAYSTAYDAIVTKINNATTESALNEIDVTSLKKTAEAKLVLAVDDLKASLISQLGTKKSFSALLYTESSYEAYSNAFNGILTVINDADTVAKLNAIDVPKLKAAAEALLKAPEVIIQSDKVTRPSSAQKDLNLFYDATSDQTVIVYSVDIVWTDLTFEYDSGAVKWNPDEHEYNVSIENPTWTDASGKVTVTNHSNTSIACEIAFREASTPNGDASLVIEAPQFTLASAENCSYENAPTVYSLITAKGTPEKEGSVGTITVKITKNS